MKIGVGIDTGGTCTDGVIYNFEEKKVLATAKTPTTKEDLSIGIGNVLDLLPREQLMQAEQISLSTTLATNACVENKGGRGKLIFLGIDRKTVERAAKSFGLPVDDTLIFIECEETLDGKIKKEPDWQQVEGMLGQALQDCQAVGIVELFAAGTGAVLEKKVRELVEKQGLPTVCGYELFQEKNVIGRGAGTLLNARLIFVIAEFLQAVKKAMAQRGLKTPVVIVRSDGSLMNEAFSRKRPIETLLCGPVASVMGAAELHQVSDGVVVDMGGTTTDISIIRRGTPIRAEGGIAVGSWNIYVKGMYVDTFGLGGDSEVLVNQEGELELGSRRIMPMCMAAARFPGLLERLEKENEENSRINTWRRHIYVGVKDIRDNQKYSDLERRIAAALYQNPMNFMELESKYKLYAMPAGLKRLIDEGVLLRCGVTPTDAMHVLGDYNGYETRASVAALTSMGKLLETTPKEVGLEIYEKMQRKLYCNIVRILLWDKYPRLRKEGKNPSFEYLVENLYEQAVYGKNQEGFLNLSLTCDAPLIGVGGPVGVFLKKVAELLGTTALIGEYSSVANALGAAVGNVEVCVTMEILPKPEDETFRVIGNGESFLAESREDAQKQAADIAGKLAYAEAIRRGAAKERVELRVVYEPVEAPTSYGTSIFISEKVSVYASCGVAVEA